MLIVTDSSDEEESTVGDIEDEEDEELPFTDAEDEEYIGRSSEFKWSSKEPTVSKLRDFDESKVGFKIDFRKINSPKDALLQFLDLKLINNICKFTNAEAKSRDPDSHPMDMAEFLGWISILVRAGETHQNLTHINVLWTSDAVYEQPFFPTVMSRSRYQPIFKYIR